MAPNTTSAADINPNENIHIPNWLNQDYFLQIIENNVENFHKIISFKPIAATAPGENYCSVIFRVIIEVELKGNRDNRLCYSDFTHKYTNFRFDHQANKLHSEDNVGREHFRCRIYKYFEYVSQRETHVFDYSAEIRETVQRSGRRSSFRAHL